MRETETSPYSISITGDPVYKEPSSFRKDSKITRLPDDFRFPKRIQRFRTEKTTTIFGAAGQKDVFQNNYLRRMSDPYDSQTRREFNETALTDPTLSRAIEIRTESFLEDDFRLKIELKSMSDDSGTPYTPEQVQQYLDQYQGEFGAYVQQIDTWRKSDEINLLQMMKLMNIATIIQGRTLAIVYPPIAELAQKELPTSTRIIHDMDMGEPIVDTGVNQDGELWKLVAVTLKLENKKMLMPDEMIYITRKNWGLRRDSAYFGTSTLEPIITASKAYRRLVNFDLSKAVVSAYFTKLIIEMLTRGEDSKANKQLNDFKEALTNRGTDIVFSNTNFKVTPVSTPVDTAMLEMAIQSFETILISNGGATKSAMSRELNLNRDLATIQEITFMKYTRKPDEKLICHEIEQQLLNPLLAHLSGMQMKDLPIRIKIERIDLDMGEQDQELADIVSTRDQPNPLTDSSSQSVVSPDDQTNDSQINNQNQLTKQKLDEVNKKNPRQKGAGKKVFGATGMSDFERALLEALKLDMKNA